MSYDDWRDYSEGPAYVPVEDPSRSQAVAKNIAAVITLIVAIVVVVVLYCMTKGD